MFINRKIINLNYSLGYKSKYQYSFYYSLHDIHMDDKNEMSIVLTHISTDGKDKIVFVIFKSLRFNGICMSI